jgi:O-antigen ligase
MFTLAVGLLLAFGAVAIGGFPSWAAAPVLVFGLTTGVLGFLEPNPLQTRFSVRDYAALFVAAVLLLLAITVQLIPLPVQFVARVSPASTEVQYERLLALADRRDPLLVPSIAADAPRPLSIAPSRTRLALAGVVAFVVFLFGAARGFSKVGVRRLSRAILILGVAVTFIGIYRIANGNVSIYGLYVPLSPARESAPFINRNHQAGWLAMVLGIGLGALAGEVARGMRGVPPTWRDRLLWLSSKQANVAALILFSSVIMAIGILTTQSRSGAAALATVFVVMIGWSLRKQPTRIRRRVLGISLLVIMLGVISFAGEGVARRLATTSWQRMDGRVAIWQDTIRIARTFWLTGSGFNTYGVAMLKYQTVKDSFRYIEAHNDYLQLAAEGGFLVGIPATLFAIVLMLTIYRRFQEGLDDTRTYWLRVGAVAGICAIAVQSVTEFTLQMSGAFAMFATLLAIAIHRPQPRPARDSG